jgi:hypothetical protein
MKELTDGAEETTEDSLNRREAVIESFKLTLKAGRWILKTPFVLVIIVATLVFDNSIRMIITLNSQYYRLIDLPEATFGLIGAGLAGLGIFIPHMARKLAEKHSPAFNLGVMFVFSICGFSLMTLFLPIAGLFPVVLLFIVIYLLRFFPSYYLNRVTSSDQRATVLSFNGLSINLAYGLIGLLYYLLLKGLRSSALENGIGFDTQALENMLFIKSISWFPWYFLLTFIAFIIFACWKLRGNEEWNRSSL